MPNPYFRFKQFTIYQDRCAMKVGTDGVLLGAWADVAGVQRILDVGTGTGLIALMLAQRSQAVIDAIEIDPEAASQAAENFCASPWADRLHCLSIAFQQYNGTGKSYDLIVSNPPYFSESLLSPNHERSRARHDRHLSHADLFSGVDKFLSEHGRLALVFPADIRETIVRYAGQYNLFPLRMAQVYPTPGKPAKRVLAEFNRKTQAIAYTDLVIGQKIRHVYSEEYKTLTNDFYL